ncbi:MAG: DUF3102 domain-containing protein [Clostridia bacterium]|nr:DUF3102 domain-containing protein [Clostridia bacterium]
MINQDGLNQLELADVLNVEGTGDRKQGTGGAEGYDAAGNLINPDREAMKRETGCYPEDLAVESQDAGLLVAANAQADAARLDALAAEINAITEQTRGVVISAALAVGKRLIEAKALVPEGRFGEWLARSVSYSERKAKDMMRLYEEYGRDGAIPESIAALDYSKAVALLTATPEDREALAERAADEDMSVRALRDEIKALKIERAKAQMKIEGLEGRVAGQVDEIARLDERERDYDIAMQREREAAKLSEAKAKAAEASAEELRKLHQDAEERASASAQRASDAVSRANQAAKDLAEARARIATLEAEAAAAPEPETKTVEVVPEEVTRELEALRRQVAEAKGPTGPTAVDRFKWFYANQMKPVFSGALQLLREVAQENSNAADVFATAITSGCKRLMEQLGTKES